MATRSSARRRGVLLLLDVATLLAVVAVAWYLWPASLGGGTRFVVVQGHSMEPTFHLGDLAVIKTIDDPHVGQIIVFHIPKGEPGAGGLVIHRIDKVRPDGSYETKGDNRTHSDSFHITNADILGSPVHAVPHLGRLIGMASKPPLVGAAAGLLTTLYLWPRRPTAPVADSDEQPDDQPEPQPEPIDWDRLAQEWLAEQLATPRG